MPSKTQTPVVGDDKFTEAVKKEVKDIVKMFNRLNKIKDELETMVEDYGEKVTEFNTIYNQLKLFEPELVNGINPPITITSEKSVVTKTKLTDEQLNEVLAGLGKTFVQGNLLKSARKLGIEKPDIKDAVARLTTSNRIVPQGGKGNGRKFTKV